MANKFTRTFDLGSLERYKKGLQNDYGKYNDPTYLGFVFLFNDYDVLESPLLVRDDNGEKVGSALNYLKNINQPQRFEYLKAFQRLLFDTNYWMPWFWQSISGIDKVWDYNKLKDPYKGGEESILTIETLESIDMRITAMMDLYRKACFDYEYRREILPANLRMFQLSVFVQEIRNIQVDYGSVGNALNTINNVTNAFGGPGSLKLPFETPAQKAAAETASVTNDFGANLMYTLRFCEFETDKSASVYSNFSNSEAQQMVQQLVISYENIDESYINPTALNIASGYNPAGNYFPEFAKLPSPETDGGASLSDTVNSLKNDPDFVQDKMSGFAKNLGAAAAGAALNAVDSLAASAVNNVQGRLSRLLLGNVYGFSPSNILTSLQQGSLLSLGPQVQNISNQSNQQNQNNPADLGNIYDT
jgi:hypothetical protein